MASLLWGLPALGCRRCSAPRCVHGAGREVQCQEVVLFVLAKPSTSKHRSPLTRMRKWRDLCFGRAGALPLSRLWLGGCCWGLGEPAPSPAAGPGPGAREERGAGGCKAPGARRLNFLCDPEASLVPAWGCPGAAESRKARKQPPSHLLHSGECVRGEAETRMHF